MASSVDAKLLKQTKFPPEFSKKVDMTKVNIEVMKKWIAGKISEILGNEDDVVIELCFNLLEGSRYPDIKLLQIQLTGFLDKDTPKFCKELWSLCQSAQSSPQGVPKELLEAKKLELRQEKLDAEKAAEEARLRKEQETARDREMETIRERERAERGRRGGGGGGGRAGRDFNRRNGRDSYSPPSRRRSPDRYARRGSRRELDSYVPPGSRKSRWDSDRGRHATRSISRSPVRDPSSSQNPRTRKRSEDRSPQGSKSRSSSPDRSNYRRGRRMSPKRRDTREKFGTRHDSESSSRSRSPRTRRRRSRSSLSHSPKPPPSQKRRPGTRDSESMSRSPSRSPYRSPSNPSRDRGDREDRENRSQSYDTKNDKKETRADIGKAHNPRDDRRLSRSRERASRRHPRSRSRNRGRAGTRSASGDRHRSRSRSRGSRRDRRKRRSLERYAPAARRRRGDSSVSLPDRKRQKTVDSDEASTSRSPTSGRRYDDGDGDDAGDKATSPEVVGNEIAESVEKD